MKPSLTATLCTRCGLCCDGSLFADVELASTDEASGLEVMGLEIEDADEGDGGLLVEPCRALKEKRCSIYAHRPDCCRRFECRLLMAVERGAVDVARASQKVEEVLKRIGRVKELVGKLGKGNECLPFKERCLEALALADAAAKNPALNGKLAELQAAITSVERLIHATFLGQGF